jgi:hypothetical protein
MKKTKPLSLIILLILLLLPFVKISPAQESYIGMQEGDEYLWKLSVYRGNFGRYFDYNVKETINKFWPLDPTINMERVYLDWVGWWIDPPQSHWPLNVTFIGPEATGTLLSPFDNTIITSTPAYGQFGWHLSRNPDYNFYFPGVWYIVNDTSSFLRQTLNLTLSFSPYGIMYVPFAPKTINWTSFITEFLGVMDSKGGFYKNISATAKSNGYSLSVPALGFENNHIPINISVRYNSNGVLSYYEFSSGDIKLTKYWLHEPSDMPKVVLAVFIIVIILLILMVVGVTIGLTVFMKKKGSREALEGIKKKDSSLGIM